MKNILVRGGERDGGTPGDIEVGGGGNLYGKLLDKILACAKVVSIEGWMEMSLPKDGVRIDVERIYIILS